MLGILTIHASKISDEDFERMVSQSGLDFEQTAAGELVVVSPGGTSGRKNRKLTGQLQLD